MTTPAIELEHVSRHFGGVVAVDDVSFAVPTGAVTGLIGPNGAGKTTMLNLITGFFRPTSGHIRVGGVDLTGRRPHVIAAAGVGRTYQNLLLLDDETVTENVRIGRHLADARYGRNRRRRPDAAPDGRGSRSVVNQLVDELGLGDVATSVVAGLPYGLRRRVEIARALAGDPSVLVLDEPTAGMTREESADIAQVIRQVRRQGTTVLLVEHNVRLVTETCDEVLVLDWGRLIGRDTAAKVWELEAVRIAYLGQSTTQPPAEVTVHADRD
jgi:branched-chain amino acid transport system ATP-binding protein